MFIFLLLKKKNILLANDLDTLLPNYLISKLQRKKLVYDSHELFLELPELINRPKKRFIWAKIESVILPKLKHTYTVCQSIADYYNNKYQTNFKVIRNIPVYVNADEIKKGRKIRNKHLKPQIPILNAKDKRPKTIIYQGAINMGRGLELMIETMQYLINYQFIIVGDGEITEEIKLLISKKNLTKKVLMIGKKTPSELKKITPIANLGISFEEDLGLNYRYALPNKLFDYIHANIPVLVSDLPEMKQIVLAYDVGETIRDRNPKALAKQIENLLEKDQTILNENLQKAACKLQWKNEEKILASIFKSAIS